jgi:hypothetical protein
MKKQAQMKEVRSGRREGGVTKVIDLVLDL